VVRSTSNAQSVFDWGDSTWCTLMKRFMRNGLSIGMAFSGFILVWQKVVVALPWLVHLRDMISIDSKRGCILKCTLEFS
jgi:hypothetical protein